MTFYILAFLTGTAQAASGERIERLIIKLRDSGTVTPQALGSDRQQALQARTGVTLTRLRTLANGAQLLKLPRALTEQDAESLAATLQTDPDVEYAEPDRRRYAADVTPNDSRYSEQWYLFDTFGGMNLPAAWSISTGAPVVVAVIDSGSRPHTEFADRILPGYDFISADPSNSFPDDPFFTANDGNGRDADASDPGNWVTQSDADAHPTLCTVEPSSWHGTFIAGMIAARGDNTLGIAGINWQAQILPVRVLGKCGGNNSDIIDAIYWAAGLPVNGVPDNTNPAQVLNLSFGGAGACGQAEQAAINAVIAAGTVVVVAAGNDSGNVSDYSPSSCNGVIVVGGTTQSGGRTSYTNTGRHVTISAPASEDDDLLSTSNTGLTSPGTDTYSFYSGTSFSTAAVSGVVSLMLSVQPLLTPAQVIRILKDNDNVRTFPDSSCTTSLCGAGIVDAGAALAAAQSYDVSSGSGGGGSCDSLSLLALLSAFVARRYRSASPPR